MLPREIQHESYVVQHVTRVLCLYQVATALLGNKKKAQGVAAAARAATRCADARGNLLQRWSKELQRRPHDDTVARTLVLLE